MLRNSVEFHDSIISSIGNEGGAIRLHLDAYVHRWQRVDGIWKGTGWMQPVQILIQGPAPVELPELPAELDSGEIVTAENTFTNLVPLPFSSAGPALLKLELKAGETFEFSGQDLVMAPTGDGRFVEDLPDDFQPSDAD